MILREEWHLQLQMKAKDYPFTSVQKTKDE
jgi:hypothetical protein